MNANSNFAFLAADWPEPHAEALADSRAACFYARRTLPEGLPAFVRVDREAAMPADRLCASFFTDLHAQGPEGVFTPAPVADVFAAIDSLAPKPATG